MNFAITNVGEDETINQTFSILTPYSQFNCGDYKSSAVMLDHGWWLLCDGRSLSSTVYPDLYDIVGTSFGSSGEGNFNLPDFRGRVAGNIGQGSGLTIRTIGTPYGVETVTLTIPQIPAHDHTGSTITAGVHNHAITDPGHTHSYFNQPNTVNPATSLTTTDVADNVNVNQITGSSTTGITINTAGAHIHTIPPQGGGLAHENMQPTLFCGNTFIFYKYFNETSY